MSASAWICNASSRVGARINASGSGIDDDAVNPSEDAAAASMRWRIGRRNASVFPLPVFATAMASLPAHATGHACCWIMDGAVNPFAVSKAWTAWEKGAASKVSKVTPGATSAAEPSRFSSAAADCAAALAAFLAALRAALSGSSSRSRFFSFFSFFSLPIVLNLDPRAVPMRCVE